MRVCLHRDSSFVLPLFYSCLTPFYTIRSSGSLTYICRVFFSPNGVFWNINTKFLLCSVNLPPFGTRLIVVVYVAIFSYLQLISLEVLLFHCLRKLHTNHVFSWLMAELTGFSSKPIMIRADVLAALGDSVCYCVQV